MHRDFDAHSIQMVRPPENPDPAVTDDRQSHTSKSPYAWRVMKKTALLHIGTWKTGTTSIQKCLTEAQLGGNLESVCYPLWTGDCNQQRLGLLYVPFDEWDPWMRSIHPKRLRQVENIRERYRKFLLQELRAASGAIFSAEMLCESSFTPERIALFRADLESAGFNDFQILLYVRDPGDLYLSWTQELLKGIFDPPLVRDPGTVAFEFRRMTDSWEEVFPGRLTVRKYLTDRNQDIVEDFAGLLQQRLGVTLPPVRMRANVSLSAEGMQILQDYRETFGLGNSAAGPVAPAVITRDVVRLTRFLDESTHDIPQTKPVLRPEVAARVRANHQAETGYLLSRYGVDLGSKGCDPVPESPPHPRPYRVEEIVESVDPEIVRQLLVRLAQVELGGNQLKRSLVMLAGQAYRRIPSDRRPARLDARLRSLVQG